LHGTEVEQRLVIRFCLWSQAIKTPQIYTRMLTQYSNNKYRGLLSKGVLLFNENVRPHSVADNVEVIRRLKFVLQPHPSLTYLLTPYRRVLLAKLTGFQLVKKLPTFYGIRRFISKFRSARQLPLS
jgi:hypothetical protein